IAPQSFAGDLLVAPTDIRNNESRGLRVFTPFWRRLQASGDPPQPLPAPNTLCGEHTLASETVESWRLEPVHPDWAVGLRDHWTPGEVAGQRRLTEFLEIGVPGYSTGRDRPDSDATSRLSPHLR